jgi:hypothetical protein
VCIFPLSFRHVFIVGLQLIPLFLRMDYSDPKKSALYRLTARNPLDVCACLWAVVIALFSFSTVAFFHEPMESVPVLILLLGTFGVSKLLPLMSYARQIVHYSVILWLVCVLGIAFAIFAKYASIPLYRFLTAVTVDAMAYVFAFVVMYRN